MSRNVFIREDVSVKPPAHCSHSLSTFYDPSVEYLFDYFNFSEFKETYDSIFYQLTRRIEEDPRARSISYNEVNLLSCLKLNLFNYASSSAIFLSALVNFLKKNSRDTVFISAPYDDKNLHIYHIIDACLPEFRNRFQILDAVDKMSRHAACIRSGSQTKNILKKCLWPGEISLSRAKPKIVFFSDYNRIKSFIPSLRGLAAFFTSSKSPKVFIQSLKDRISYIQIDKHCDDGDRYAVIVNDIVQAITDSDIFTGIKTKECDLDFILKQRMYYLSRAYLPGLLRQIDSFHNFFSKNPSIGTALLDEDITPPKNAFCQVSRKYSVDSFVECHGSLYGAYSFVPLTANYIFTWGSDQKNRITGWGCPPEKVIVSGCSRYGQYKHMDDDSLKEKVFARLGFDKKLKTIVFVPQSKISELCFIEKDVLKRIEAILDIILRYPDIQLVIKLHASDTSFDFYKKRCQETDVRCRVKILKIFDPYLLIRSSDFLIVHDSTMAIDAFKFERNVIFFPATESVSRVLNNSISDFEKYNVFYRPSNMEDFKNIFERLLRDSRLRPECAMWQEARKNCLNECEPNPESVIKSYLMKNG